MLVYMRKVKPLIEALYKNDPVDAAEAKFIWLKSRCFGWPVVPVLLIFIISLIVGIWYAVQQIDVISPELAGDYPILPRVGVLLQVGFVIFIAYFGLVMILRWLRGTPATMALRTGAALCFLPLTLVLLKLPTLSVGLPVRYHIFDLYGYYVQLDPGNGIPVSIVLSIFLMLLMAIAAMLKASSQHRRDVLREPILVFAGLSIVLYLTQGFFSPANWDRILDVGTGFYQQEQPAIMPVYKSFIWAKFFSFSNFDYSYFGAVPHTPTSYGSFPLTLLALLSDAPSIEPAAFYRLFYLVLFCLLLLGSFGTYLLLRKGARIGLGASIGGGLGFVLANRALYENIVSETHLNIASYAVFPFAALFLVLALRDRRPLLALWSGMTLGSQFYLASPHPEGTLYSFLMYGVFAFALLVMCVTQRESLKRYALLMVYAGAGLVLTSMGHLLPVLHAQATDVMYVFGHLSEPRMDIWSSGWTDIGRYRMKPQAIMVLILIVPVFWRQIREGKVEPIFCAMLSIFAFIIMLVHPWTAASIFNFLGSLGVNLNSIAPQRIGIWFSFSATVLVAIGLDATVYVVRREVPVVYRALGSLWPRVRLSFFTDTARTLYIKNLPTQGLQPLTGGFQLISMVILMVFLLEMTTSKPGHWVDNPKGCHYYVSMQAGISNMDGLAKDKASLTYLQQRMVEFEQTATLARTPYTTKLLKDYRDRIRAEFNVGTASALSEAQIPSAARLLASVIDQLNLGPESCVHPLIKGPGRWKRLVQYNLDALYSQGVSPYQRILAATKGKGNPHSDDSHLGLGAGLLNHSASTNLDSRFMMGIPLIHALYLIPGHDYSNRGFYQHPMPWALEAERVMRPDVRRLFNISGVDVMTFNRIDIDNTIDTSDMDEITTDVHREIDPDYVVFRDARSFGLAYMARRVSEIGGSEIEKAEKVIVDYFHNRVELKDYTDNNEKLRGYLLDLQGTEATLVEKTNGPIAPKPLFAYDHSPGQVEILGIKGPRTAMRANCDKPSCTLVYNMAATAGWHAYVDGLQVDISRANLGFMSINVPQGEHGVWFFYAPTVALFMWITILFVFGLFWATAYVQKSEI